MNSSGATVLKLTPRKQNFDFQITEENLQMALHYIGETEEGMLESFYEDNIVNKLIIKDKEKFKKDYTKAYIKLYTDQANRYGES
ncbi:MAG: hypothetical protein ACI35O_10350 [Bacillaceae bacterium]